MKKLTFLFVFAFIALFAFTGTALAVEQSVRLTASGWLSTSAQKRTLRDCVANAGDATFAASVTSATYNYDYFDVPSGETLQKDYRDRDKSSPTVDNGGIKCDGGCYATITGSGTGKSLVCHFR